MRCVSTHPVLFEARLELRVILVVRLSGLLPFLCLPVRGDLIENFNLIIGSFEIMLSALLHFHCYIAIVLEVLSQPDCGEMAPAELLNDNVSVDEDFTHMHRMISTDLVVGHPLILA
jgi:hypothetical protein